MPSLRFATLLATAAVQPAPAPNAFDAIDISKTAGDGQAALAAAQAVCPATDTPDELKQKGDTAESAEQEIFNPQIASAADPATKKAIYCQKQRNKVLKNHCQQQKAELDKDQANIDKNSKQVANNIKAVDKECQGVDESLFIGGNGAAAAAAGAEIDVADPAAATNAAKDAGAAANPNGEQGDATEAAENAEDEKDGTEGKAGKEDKKAEGDNADE